jgi:hypothetical protein
LVTLESVQLMWSAARWLIISGNVSNAAVVTPAA